MAREGNYLAADQVVWTRSTGQVRAQGNVVVVNPSGDKLIGENVVLADTLRDGTIDNLLVALESGGRIAAARATRDGDVTILENAVYSACPVTTRDRLPARAELGDHRRAGDPGPEPRPRHFPRRPPARVRHYIAVAADLQRQHRRGRRHRPAPSRPQDFAQERVRGRASLSLADRVQPRPDGDAAPLHRHRAGDRGQVPASQPARRVPGRRLPRLQPHRRRRFRGAAPTTSARACALTSRRTDGRSSTPPGR